MVVQTCDVLIVGAGVNGLTTALQLAIRGATVVIVDQTSPAQQASWAGAGMLPPGFRTTAESPELRLRSLSCQLWPAVNRQLQELQCLDNEFVQCGAMLLFQRYDEAQREAHKWQQDGAVAELHDVRSLQSRCPQIGPAWQFAVELPEQAQVRNPRHLKSLLEACRRLGVQILSDCACPPLTKQISSGRIEIGEQRFEFQKMLLCCGAWISELLSRYSPGFAVQPVRGQIAQLRGAPDLLPCILEVGRRYLVPRQDGLILVGSTEEHVGFQCETTEQGVQELLRFAADVVPELAGLPLVHQWAGLRPGSPDELPAIGFLPGFENVVIACGHFRSGLQMSPGTAAIASALLCGETPPIEIIGFEPERFLANAEGTSSGSVPVE